MGHVVECLAANDEKVNLLMKFPEFCEYLVCDSPTLPLLIIRPNSSFGEKMRKAIPSLKQSDATDLSNLVFDPTSSGKVTSIPFTFILCL